MQLNIRFLFLTALSAGALSAQSDGVIEGLVRDPSGAAIPGAQVELIREETGVVRQAPADERGEYRALSLEPGTYRVQAKAEGFIAQEREGLELSAGRTLRADFNLSIGADREVVNVTGETPLLSSAAGDWGGLVSSQKLAQLPLNGRDLFELAALEPGATKPTAARVSLAQGIGGQISVNGSRPNQNGYQIDGVWVNGPAKSLPASAAGNLLGLETVREIHMVTNPFDAKLGRMAGGVFTAVSESGQNRFHGSLYEYLRNSSLDAKNFFDSPGDPIPPLRRNQFGAKLSGPAVKDRLWFLVNYEGLRTSRGRTARPTVPTLEARQGRLPSADGGVRQVAVADSVKPYLDLYPAPNGRDFGDGTAESARQVTTSVNEDYVAAKVDLQLDDSMRLSSRYSLDDSLLSDPDDMAIWHFLLGSRDHFWYSNLQKIFSPRTIGDFQVAYSRVNNAETSSLRSDVGSDLSFVPGQPLGTLTVTGLSDFGGFQARARPRRFVLNSLQMSGHMSWWLGRHTVKAGAGVDRVRFYQDSDLSAVGSYTFNSVENLLLGVASNAEVMDPNSDTQRLWTYYQPYFYVQDEVKLSQRLSVSLGLRWEAASTPQEANGKISVLRDLYRDTEPTLGGPLFTNPSWTNFAPRASLAWDPTGQGRTVVRAGGGIFYDLIGSRELLIAGVRTPPFFNRILIFGRPAFPDILQAAAGRNPSASIDGLDYGLQQPYVGRWQLNLEHRLAPETVVRLGYSGMRGIHLMGQLGNFNTPVPERQADGRWFFPADAPRLNPAFSRIGLRRSQFNSFYQGVTASLERRLRNNIRFQAKYSFSKSIDESSSPTFNDFEASDQIPTTPDYRANRGLSDFDLRHVFAGSFSYLLPTLDNSSARWLLGGWELHGLTQIQSGNPFAPSVGFDRARLLTGFGDTGQRPDAIAPAGSAAILGGPDQYFDPNVFGLPAAGYLGTLGRGTLRGPGMFTLDLAIHKSFRVTERQTVRLRGEFFNVTNESNFQIPSGQELFTEQGTRVGSAGRITSTATPARQIQVAVRYEF
ncbi:MAG: carboxypeptidase regulatory-like domain-containing protein [Bryobacterales bacterium]